MLSIEIMRLSHIATSTISMCTILNFLCGFQTACVHNECIGISLWFCYLAWVLPRFFSNWFSLPMCIASLWTLKPFNMLFTLQLRSNTMIASAVCVFRCHYFFYFLLSLLLYLPLAFSLSFPLLLALPLFRYFYPSLSRSLFVNFAQMIRRFIVHLCIGNWSIFCFVNFLRFSNWPTAKIFKHWIKYFHSTQINSQNWNFGIDSMFNMSLYECISRQFRFL